MKYQYPSQFYVSLYVKIIFNALHMLVSGEKEIFKAFLKLSIQQSKFDFA